jgi:glycosyltransferase involved in cell wall biosynthesis
MTNMECGAFPPLLFFFGSLPRNQSGGKAPHSKSNMPIANHTSSNGCNLSVVIPVFNEQRSLLDTVGRVETIPLAKEIILVDDGSKDGTRELLKSLEGKGGIRVFYHERNQGKGAALRTGIRQVRGDIVLFQDADQEYDPSDIPHLVKPILDGKADVVLGSRLLGNPTWQSSLNYLANRVLTLFSNLLSNVRLTDMETGYKVFRREVLQDMVGALKENRFGIEPELIAKIARRGHRIKEVPIKYNARSHAQGKKIGWKDGVRALWCIVRYSRWD